MSSTQSSRILTPADSGGPSSPPPTLPEGWLAQWEGVSRKWYYVQRATGKSQWEVPTEPFIPTPSSTPQSAASPSPYHPPRMGSLPAQDTTEATRELMSLRGGNMRQSGGSFPNTHFDSSTVTPQSTQEYQQVPSAGSQSTPVAGVSNHQSRSPSQGILNQVASDLAHRVAEGQSNQQTSDQSQFSYSQPGPYTNNFNPQYPSGPNQFHQGYQMGQENVQMQDASPIGAASSPQQQDPSVAYHADTNMYAQQQQQYSLGQAAGLAPNTDSQYQYHPAQNQSTVQQPADQTMMQPGQQYAPAPPQVDPNAITVIHREPGAPPLFPTPHRGGPRQPHNSRITTPPRSAAHYDTHPRQYYANEPRSSNSPPTAMHNQPPYPHQDAMYPQHSMGPPPPHYGNRGDYPYDSRAYRPVDDYGMPRPGPSPPGMHGGGRYPPAHQYGGGGGYGR
ncbi:hypothetical protein AJ79_00239 [Helicocarpus griseus UAMH5409]|uniref:WW domain-containing protein n=1 Tax=Helicocarpus griseus UAMH5409 TaxID=1447875 RepID=A0A2B7YBA9_9EURO|nr:hypothetical protein AJ79_00239 [Helicocarpus griseus UAMH5409]